MKYSSLIIFYSKLILFFFKMPMDIETCPIKEIYNAINHLNQFGQSLQFYKTPKFSVGNTRTKSKDQRKSNSTKNQKQTYKQLKKGLSKDIVKMNTPGPGHYFKTQIKKGKKAQLKLNKQKENYFGNQKRKISYIPKTTQNTISRGPSNQDIIKSLDFNIKSYNPMNCPNNMISSHIQQNRSYVQQLQRKSLETPGVGQYNLRYCRAVSAHVRTAQWPKLSRQNLLQQQKRKLKIFKKKSKTPSPTTYNTNPTMIPLFANMNMSKKQQRQNIRRKNNQIEGMQQKVHKKVQKEIVGPGKYLKLDNWVRKNNFITTVKTQSVYYR